ncbi:MAG: AAA family ATPase [Halococcoides sp.]
MEGPLWTTVHAPSIDDLPQSEVREHCRTLIEEPMNAFVHGPRGSGKTAAVGALARAAHADADNDYVVINVADLFAMSKSDLADDPRFGSFLDATRRRNSSKADLVNHVLKEIASYSPVAGSYKTILLDDAGAMRQDFQQALRRIMERYHEATQFVIATRRPGAVIPPIRSRCYPVAVRAPTIGEIVGVLATICEREGVTATDDGLEYVAGYADGNLRRAILAAQTTAVEADEITMEAAYETLSAVETDEAADDILQAAEDGAFQDARSLIDEQLIDEGHTGQEVLEDILGAARSRYAGDRLARVVELAADVDFDLETGTNDRLHLSHFVADLAEMTR